MKPLLPLLACLASLAFAADLRKDIVYARPDGVPLKMDVSIPDGKGPFPTVILVHGGGWRNGDKQKYITPLFQPLTEAGFAWFSIDYRLAPQYHYPAAVDDVVSAIRFIEAHARDYKANPHRIAIVGESAGGHLVALVGARYGKQLHLAAVVPFYPVTDMTRRLADDNAIPVFLGDSSAALAQEASPVTYVTQGLPPFLFIHGTGDKTVPFEQSVEMCDKLKEAGDACELYPVEGAPHGVAGWENHPEWQPYKQKFTAWLKEKLK
jgi:alpha-L-fucosidase 2